MDHNESPPSIRINPSVALNGPEEHLLDEIRQVITECLVFVECTLDCTFVIKKNSIRFIHYFITFRSEIARLLNINP